MLKKWQDKRHKFPHVGKLADTMDELMFLVASGSQPPNDMDKLIKHIESVANIIDLFYTDKAVCDLATESVELVIKSVRNHFVDASDLARVEQISLQLQRFCE